MGRARPCNRNLSSQVYRGYHVLPRRYRANGPPSKVPDTPKPMTALFASRPVDMPPAPL